MAIIKADTRRVEKRSILTGVVPTVPPSADFTDGTWPNTAIMAGELFFNDADLRLWIGTTGGSIEIPLSGSSLYALDQVLVAGNETGSNDIKISSGQSIQSTNITTSMDASMDVGGYLALDYGSNTGTVMLSTDLGLYTAGQLYMEPGKIDLSTFLNDGAITIRSSSSTIIVADPSVVRPYYINIEGDLTYLYGKEADANPSSVESLILIGNTATFDLTAAATAYTAGIIINSSNSTSILANTSFNTALSCDGGSMYGNNNVMSGTGNNQNDGNNNVMSGTGNNQNDGNNNVMSGTGNNNYGNNNINAGDTNTINQVDNSLIIGTGNIMINPGIMYSDFNGFNGSNGLSSAGASTTGAVNNTLLTKVGGTPFTIENNTVYRIHLTILAVDIATNDTKEWEGFGIIKNISGTTSGTINLVSTIGSVSLAGATATATANGAGAQPYLGINVTGVAGSTIKWLAGIRYDKIEI